MLKQQQHNNKNSHCKIAVYLIILFSCDQNDTLRLGMINCQKVIWTELDRSDFWCLEDEIRCLLSSDSRFGSSCSCTALKQWGMRNDFPCYLCVCSHNKVNSLFFRLTFLRPFWLPTLLPSPTNAPLHLSSNSSSFQAPFISPSNSTSNSVSTSPSNVYIRSQGTHLPILIFTETFRLFSTQITWRQLRLNVWHGQVELDIC